MSPWVFVGIGLVLAAVGGVVLSRALGSRETDPEALEGNPLPPCPDGPLNCTRLTERFGVSAHLLRNALLNAIGASGHLWTGSPGEVEELDGRFRVTYRVGPFRDHVEALIRPGKHEDEAWLHLKSTARVGQSDLGVNSRRARRIVDGVRANLQELTSGRS